MLRYKFLRFPNGKSKAVTFSYDDACRHDIKFVQTINKYGIKCTFNLNTDMYGKSETDGRLTKEEIKKYLAEGEHEIAIHGANHKAPGIISPLEGIRDVLDCRMNLEKDFNRIVRGMAYPDCGIKKMSPGNNPENIKSYLKNLGVVYARTLDKDNNSFELPSDWLEWYPSVHHSNPVVLKYIDEFLDINVDSACSTRRLPRLFYIWGHSYEFENDNNWELLETICKKISSKEDIWYATNIEIYDYVTAYNSLVFSADNSIVYNPTLFDIWFDIDAKLYKIVPGQTLII